MSRDYYGLFSVISVEGVSDRKFPENSFNFFRGRFPKLANFVNYVVEFFVDSSVNF